MTRLLWLAALCIIALATIFAQLDRQARYSPEFSPFVPGPFASFSLLHSQRIASRTGNQDKALADARALVKRRPIPASHQRLLAEAQLAIGDQSRASATLQRAGANGWRDTNLQSAMLLLALNAEDDRQAAMRLAALWAISGDREILQRYSALVLGRPIARARFVQILSAARWRNNLLQNGTVVLPPELFGIVLGDSLRAGTRFDCTLLRRNQDFLKQRGIAADTSANHIPCTP